ncbi:hypothetical protein BLNAU_20703 [Blattamonas nauphoetae]|uniref:Protein kinase domain-containing protein n=1 Tax=Blattamonas nauphoetae TaxID=2049346 RepID=A0ABQ9WYG9_9EUKA|nr:hypothetical protein BLNAU_20703 [Blattamonas nauphoetae]
MKDTSSEYSLGGGALYLNGDHYNNIHGKQFKLVGCVFADCSANTFGGGVYLGGGIDLSVFGTKFERCASAHSGGGMSTVQPSITNVIVEWSHFVECSARLIGGALMHVDRGILNISNTLVKDCHSGTTGAIFLNPSDELPVYLFSHVLFAGNTVGETTPLSDEQSEGIELQHVDLTLSINLTNIPTSFKLDCFTTSGPHSSGLSLAEYEDESEFNGRITHLEEEFKKIGPLLTAKPTGRVNKETGKIELEMEGKTPLTSQEYEVTVKDEDGTDARFRMLFSDGTGTLVSGSELNLHFNTSYTVTSIVGVVPDSSSSTLTNDFTIPRAVWIFNLDVTPDFLSFTTPSPHCLTSVMAYLISAEPTDAYLILLFDKDVSGSFDFVMEEDGNDVTITVSIKTENLAGESSMFIVVGDDRLLTHDTTYTIKSIVPTPNTDSPTDVRMNRTVSFHIPKSSNVPSGKDDKKSMSLETKRLLSWLIPLVACLLVAVLLAIIVIVLLRRRKQKNTEPAQKEMEDQDQVEVDEKMDVLVDDQTKSVLHTDGRSHAAFGSSNVHSTRHNPSSQEMKTMSETKAGLVEVMACSGGFEVSMIGDYTTLYNVLHKEHREIPKRALGRQIVNGLKAVLANRQASDVLTRLSSHWILIDTAGNVQLKLQMSSTEAEQEAAHTKQQPTMSADHGTVQNMPKDVEQSGIDGLRWRAPQVVAGGGSAVDGHKASVFSLGLILWEIETGQVPFGELDAVNAQRQSATGIGPKMESLQNEEFIALILQCMSANPEQRPSLSEIGEFLSSHPEVLHNEKIDQAQ